MYTILRNNTYNNTYTICASQQLLFLILGLLLEIHFLAFYQTVWISLLIFILFAL